MSVKIRNHTAKGHILHRDCQDNLLPLILKRTFGQVILKKHLLIVHLCQQPQSIPLSTGHAEHLPESIAVFRKRIKQCRLFLP